MRRIMLIGLRVSFSLSRLGSLTRRNPAVKFRGFAAQRPPNQSRLLSAIVSTKVASEVYSAIMTIRLLEQ